MQVAISHNKIVQEGKDPSKTPVVSNNAATSNSKVTGHSSREINKQNLKVVCNSLTGLLNRNRPNHSKADSNPNPLTPISNSEAITPSNLNRHNRDSNLSSQGATGRHAPTTARKVGATGRQENSGHHKDHLLNNRIKQVNIKRPRL
jgi:hypothetical protein